MEPRNNTCSTEASCCCCTGLQLGGAFLCSCFYVPFLLHVRQLGGLIQDIKASSSQLPGIHTAYMGLPGGSVVKNPPATVGDIGDVGSIPGSGRSPGGGHGYPLQYSGLENPHGQRSLVGPLCGVSESRTWLSEHTLLPLKHGATCFFI